MFTFLHFYFEGAYPNKEYGPILNFLDIENIGVAIPVIAERVRSKAYHDMRNYCLKVEHMDKETATHAGRIASRFHLRLWKLKLSMA